ncbi:putative toxin-antitoxin system toxin component, PIN family [Marinoscillum sp.]|uniref:putative toxin-antitoxin system toxin component, PIN family n=1 Tax=Marinoscillum sp. TaxID=2024838 RepID=UPI003BABFABA
MKVFGDTNFLISAFATRGLSTDVLSLVITRHELIISEFVLQELSEKLRTKLKLPQGDIRDIELFLRTFTVINPSEKSTYHLRDPDDEWVLAAALEAKSDVLITGDKDLLDENDSITELEILTPRGFWELLKH